MRGDDLKDHIYTRVLELADFIIDNNATVRSAAKEFGVSKSTVHKDMRTRLQHINHKKYDKVAKILEYNLSDRHIRGGIATKEKYKQLRAGKNK